MRACAVTIVLGCFAAGCASAAAGTSSAKAPPVEVRLEGTPVDLTADLRPQVVAIARAWLSPPLALVAPDGRRIARPRHAWGARVDLDEAVRLLAAAKDPGSAMRRAHFGWRGQAALSLSLPVELDHEPALAAVIALGDELDHEPVPARLDTRTGAVLPHVDGLRIDAWRTIDAIERAVADGRPEVAAAAHVLRAARRTDELSDVSTAVVLGSFETRYDASDRAADRTYNLRVAAAKLDGLVLLPGETFDFNAVVGERSEANGFRVAPVIAQGELVDGVGGGTCQISGTLHAAAFFAGLPIIERRPHSRPSSYLKLGLDAMVSYPTINFRFQNDRDFPIAIAFTVEGGVARAAILGARHELRVTFVRRIDGTTAFDERVVEDPSLPSGVRVLSQRGVPGFRVTRWRILRDVERSQAVRERFEDDYPPTTQIWRVGTGGRAPSGYAPPLGDTHPEYTADAFLELTSGAGIDGFRELRRAGRTGTPGWTATARGAPAPD